jgi:predicted metal-dependent HD superfamily phosphohydrolase
MQTLTSSMRERWVALCRRLGPGGDPAALATGVEALYAHPARAYHSLEHIAACLSVFDRFRPHAVQADFVEFAIWMHDCVYDPKAKDNEARSAEAAVELLRSLGAGFRHAEAVTQLIMATRHGAADLTGDEALIADIDLSILGSDAAAYLRYARNIRTEYSFVPEEAFRAGRAAILRAFVARDRIYFTEPLRLCYESGARANLATEIAMLESGRSV